MIFEKARFLSLVAAICVVAIHCVGRFMTHGDAVWWLNRMLPHGVFGFAVPYFFLIAGYFSVLKPKESYLELIRSKIRTLLVPFVVWSILFWIELTLVRIVQNGFALNDGVRMESLTSVLGLDLAEMPLLYPFWFVRVLFVFFCMLPVFCWLSKTRIRLFAALIAFVGLAVYATSSSPGTSVQRILRLSFSCEGAAYFLVGCYLAAHPLVRIDAALKGRVLLTGGALGAFVVSASELDGCGHALAILLLNASVTASAIMLAPPVRLSQRIANFAFPLYVLHPFVLVLLALVRGKFMGPLGGGVFGFVATWGVTVVLVWWLYNCIVSRNPRIFGWMFGGRLK